MEIEPGERGSGFMFINNVVGGVIPKEFIPSIEKGVFGAMTRGVLAGYPIVDVICKHRSMCLYLSLPLFKPLAA
jgi:elongation factor G